MTTHDNTQMLPVGTMLDGRYRIERYLASGGFGNTYVAFDTRFNSRVAIKEFFMHGTNHRDGNSSAVVVSNVANVDGFNQQLDKFRREAKRIFDMRNDHIVHVIDLFDANGTSYYVMDFIEGESLSARVKRNPLPEAEVRDVAAQLLDALDAVHKAGFFHLDVKPGNIMIDKDGHCTLIDFGASKQMSAMERTSMSASGMAYTPGYAPIEQEMQRMKSIGPWTDFYAVGATLYNLLTGQRPPEVDPDDTGDDSRMFDYPAGVSMIMMRTVSCMMNPSPRKRPQNVEEVKALLEGRFVRKSDVGEDAVTAQSPQSATYSIQPSTGSSEASGIKKTKSKKRIWLLAGVVALGLALAALISSFILAESNKDHNTVAPITIKLSGEYQLKGAIADKPIKWMKLNVLEDIVKGSMYYASQESTKMTLEGKVDFLGKIVMTEKAVNGKETGRFEGIFQGEHFNGTYTDLATNETSTFQLNMLTPEETKAIGSASAGLSFRTFTMQDKADIYGIVQRHIGNEQIVNNLKELGFSLISSRTMEREDYTGEAYETKIDTYSKMVYDRVTTVKLDEDYTEINFPNFRDVDEFKETIKKCGMKESKDGFKDPSECYYAGTDVTVEGTIVTLSYRWEP